MANELTVEGTKDLLRSDLESYPPSLMNPIGDARTYQKIQNYLYACIIGRIEKSECVDWLYELYKNQTDEEHDRFSSQIDLLANALYNFYSFLKTQHYATNR